MRSIAGRRIKQLLVSIHAPVRGAMVVTFNKKRLGCFNSRTREGCDTPEGAGVTGSIVSIHAPVRGAIPTA